MSYPYLDAALDELSRITETVADGKLFAVLDGAQSDLIEPEVNAAAAKCASLFKGRLPPEVAAAAPWLVELDRGGNTLTQWLVDEGFGKSWGIFCVTQATHPALRKHLRRFLKVQLEGRPGSVFFRYFDPRIFRVFLPTCTPDELDAWFGPVAAFVVEGDEPNTLIELTRDDAGQLVQTVASLEAAPATAAAPLDVADVVEQIRAVGAQVDALKDTGAPNDEAEAFRTALERLEQLQALVAQAPADDDPVVAALSTHLRRVTLRLRTRRKPSGRAASVAISSLLFGLRQLTAPDPS